MTHGSRNLWEGQRARVEGGQEPDPKSHYGLLPGDTTAPMLGQTRQQVSDPCGTATMAPSDRDGTPPLPHMLPAASGHLAG